MTKKDTKKRRVTRSKTKKNKYKEWGNKYLRAWNNTKKNRNTRNQLKRTERRRTKYSLHHGETRSNVDA